MFKRGVYDGGWWYQAGAGGMLAFDIETTGVCPRRGHVTCACAYDPEAGVERTFYFGAGQTGDAEEFMGLLDGAPRLCAFNGVRFDLPFLAHCWGVPAGRVGGWVRKLVDPFEASKLVLCRTFSLNRLLGCNGLQGKTGSGLQAVTMALEGRWEELGEYCMHDTKMTHRVASLAAMALPLGQVKSKGMTSATDQYQSSRVFSSVAAGDSSGNLMLPREDGRERLEGEE